MPFEFESDSKADATRTDTCGVSTNNNKTLETKLRKMNGNNNNNNATTTQVFFNHLCMSPMSNGAATAPRAPKVSRRRPVAAAATDDYDIDGFQTELFCSAKKL